MNIVLIGNKKDLESDRQVRYADGMEFAKRNNLIFFETSAKMNENVEEAFVNVTKTIYKNAKRGDVYDISDKSTGIYPGNVGKAAFAAKNDTKLLISARPTSKKRRICC